MPDFISAKTDRPRASSRLCRALFVSTLALHSVSSFATGMVPESSLLLVSDADKSSTMNLKNTDATAELLYTRIVDLPDDTGTHLIVTQPVSRVEPGKTQQVRFILTTDKPMTTEHLKRVTFEGIPPMEKSGHKVQLNIRQDLPVLIHPASLAVVRDAWKLLTWHQDGSLLTVSNPSPYVVRLSQEVLLLPSKGHGKLDKTYLLPGQHAQIKMTGASASDRQVKFFPASRYGVQVNDFTTDLN